MISQLELDRYRPQRFGGLRQLQYAIFDPLYFVEMAPHTGVRAEGMRYEYRIQAAFALRYSAPNSESMYAPGMWIRYVDSSRREYAQPDGLLVNFKRRLITVIEIKLKHTIAAWFWLRELYEPLIRHIFGHSWKYAVCEVVKWYDASVQWPEPLRMTADPSMLIANEFGLHICKR
jgi:hypothetical protein